MEKYLMPLSLAHKSITMTKRVSVDPCQSRRGRNGSTYATPTFQLAWFGAWLLQRFAPGHRVAYQSGQGLDQHLSMKVLCERVIQQLGAAQAPSLMLSSIAICRL